VEIPNCSESQISSKTVGCTKIRLSRSKAIDTTAYCGTLRRLSLLDGRKLHSCGEVWSFSTTPPRMAYFGHKGWMQSWNI